METLCRRQYDMYVMLFVIMTPCQSHRRRKSRLGGACESRVLVHYALSSLMSSKTICSVHAQGAKDPALKPSPPPSARPRSCSPVFSPPHRPLFLQTMGSAPAHPFHAG